MKICIVYTPNEKVAGLWVNIKRGIQAAKEIGGRYEIRNTVDTVDLPINYKNK